MPEKIDNNASAVGIAAARMMEKLDEIYPDGIKVSNAIILVEVTVPLPLEDDEKEEDRDWVEIFDFYSTTDSRSSQLGIIELAKLQIVASQIEIMDIDGDDEDEDE